MPLMHNPPHPGKVIREYLGDTPIAAAASKLKVARSTLSRIVTCRTGISPEMALRLGAAFGTSPEMWAGMQMQYDLYQAKQMKRPRIARLGTSTNPAGRSARKSPRQPLAQLLAAFDPQKHGGEVMADAPVGAEAFAQSRGLTRRSKRH